MIDYRPLDEIIHGSGLRLVLVRGYPSPWGQAAKAIFEIKGLHFAVGAQEAGGTNDKLVAWCGENSGPVVAWEREKPITRWNDILMLAERLAPTPSLLPPDATDRALMIGLANELCGELGLGWNRRLQLWAPIMAAGNVPEGVLLMAAKYRFNQQDLALAGRRIAAVLRALTAQLEAQEARGRAFFVGEHLSALDIYWAAFANLIALQPKEEVPIPDEMRPLFDCPDADVSAALAPILLRHRDRIFKAYFHNPMEL